MFACCEGNAIGMVAIREHHQSQGCNGSLCGDVAEWVRHCCIRHKDQAGVGGLREMIYLLKWASDNLHCSLPPKSFAILQARFDDIITALDAR